MDQSPVADRSQIVSLGIAGGLGGVATVINTHLHGRRMSVVEGALRVVTGALVSIYWAPPVAGYLHLEHPDTLGGVAFGLGIISMTAISILLRLAAGFAKDPAAVLATLRGRAVAAASDGPDGGEDA